MVVFSNSDYDFALSFGISKESLDLQWRRLNDGFPKIELDRPALVGDGIVRLSEGEKKNLIRLFDEQKEDYNILKFVPASGAASRMFSPIRKMLENPESETSQEILKNIRSFPFYSNLIKEAKEKNLDAEVLLSNAKKLADFILNTEGLNYNVYPKGLIPFSCIDGLVTTAFEQQVLEADEICDRNIHFTVDNAFMDEIKHFLNEENASFSIQEPATHFIAMHASSPIRDSKGALIFRPSGHGALLDNLSAIEADIVFIKNIDNIQIPEKNKASIESKKIMGAYLFQIKIQIDTFLWQLEEDENVDLDSIRSWIKDNLATSFNGTSKKDIYTYLHRPIRVVGMVLNEGKAGGGPFWVKSNTTVSLQIVEGAQIVKEDKKQKGILNASTHFNPVDLVCSLKDHKGEKFNLFDYVDMESGFLSNKVVDEKDAIIMERPGLWNGSMANWISVFIELPLESFTPVKTILDLIE